MGSMAFPNFSPGVLRDWYHMIIWDRIKIVYNAAIESENV